MPSGFFKTEDLQLTRKAFTGVVAQCNLCQLYKHCRSPKMPVSGKGRKQILILGESPGRQEDEQGKPFVGVSGQLLSTSLFRLGVELRQDCWIYNSVICHPRNNILPDSAISYCRPNVIRTIQQLQPRLIILLGATAVKSLIGWLWKEDVGATSRWMGQRIPSQRLNAWVAATWHPAHLLRARKGERHDLALEGLFERHLERAIALTERPFVEIPNYLSQVKSIINTDEAANYVTKFLKRGKPVAFDFETDRLKPDHNDAQILTCAVSDGTETCSFPWDGKVVPAMKELLLSEVPKIGFNCKFEERYTRRILKINVNNWIWDGMLAAHVLDNRRGVCSLKFQAFTKLGMDSYDEKTKPYMRTKSANERNKLKELPLKTLLDYCGLDALLTYQLAQIQMKELGHQHEKSFRG